MGEERSYKRLRDQEIAERHRPLLILYPEISTENRRVRPDWRRQGEAPLYEDYHPRDVRLLLDHARTRPRGAWLHDADGLMRELEHKTDIPRIDLLRGPGHRDRKKFWREYYRIVNNIGEHQHEPYPYCSYVNMVYGDDLPRTPYAGLVAIQYWFVFLYNDWKAPHEGDWENIVVYLRLSDNSTNEPEPIACAYSAHHGGYRLGWRYVEKVDGDGNRTDSGTHPVVYVANGSHANYFVGPYRYETDTKVFGVKVTAGDFPFAGNFIDFTTSFEDGHRIFPEVKVVPARLEGRWTEGWRWLNFRGTWGSKGWPRFMLHWVRRLPVIGGTWKGPDSLPGRRNWKNPFAWADDECDEPPAWLTRQAQ